MPLSGYMNTHATSAQARPESWADGGGVGHLGLWPAFSLLNHSCLPSAVNYVVGDLMVVHAGRHVSKVSESGYTGAWAGACAGARAGAREQPVAGMRQCTLRVYPRMAWNCVPFSRCFVPPPPPHTHTP